MTDKKRRADDERRRRIREHARTCPQLACQDDDDKEQCTFTAGDLYCTADPCPNRRHRQRPEGRNRRRRVAIPSDLDAAAAAMRDRYQTA